MTLHCAWCLAHFTFTIYFSLLNGGSVSKWLVCWTQAWKGLGSNQSRDTVR